MANLRKLKVVELKELLIQKARDEKVNLKISAVKKKDDYIAILEGRQPIPSKIVRGVGSSSVSNKKVSEISNTKADKTARVLKNRKFFLLAL